MIYILQHQDIPVCLFELETEVKKASINEKTKEHLPLPLKKLFRFSDAFISNATAGNYELSEEGCFLVDKWLNDRTIPVDREQYLEKYTQGKNLLTWMLENHATSLTDCYWIKRINETLCWSEVKLFNNQRIDSLYLDKIADKERKYSGVNSTLGGTLEKYWFYELHDIDGKIVKELRLCKRIDKLSDILSIREVIANLVCKAIGYDNYCKYDYVINHENEIVGCHCKCFTNEDAELITAYDLLEEHNETQSDDVYEKIIEYAVSYGADKKQIIKYMDTQTVMDYLITNRDRHQGNIGFLRDINTLQIIAPAPIYDSGSAKNLELEKPLGVTMTKINGLYNTELECLAHVTTLSTIDLSNLKNLRIDYELEKSSSLSKYNKEMYYALYKEKLAYLEEMAKKETHRSEPLKTI